MFFPKNNNNYNEPGIVVHDGPDGSENLEILGLWTTIFNKIHKKIILKIHDFCLIVLNNLQFFFV